jgi:hypothetical protein
VRRDAAKIETANGRHERFDREEADTCIRSLPRLIKIALAPVQMSDARCRLLIFDRDAKPTYAAGPCACGSGR